MKNVIICVLIGAMAVSGVLYYKESQKTWEALARIAELEKQLGDLEAKTAKQDEKTADLRTQLLTSKVEAVSKATEVAQLQQSMTNRPAESGSNMFAGMFKDPAMKEMIKTQQKMMGGQMVEMLYSGLFTNLNLNPDQTAALKELLKKRQLIDSEAGIAMLGDDLDADKRKALTDQTKADRDAVNAQIKQTIGDAGYAQLDAWDKSAGDRMTLTMFKGQLGDSAPALSPDQEGQMLQAMSEERQKFKFTTDFSDKNNFNGDLASMFTEDKINQFTSESGQLMSNYLSRAQSILSPEQLQAFQSSLNSQQQMTAAGMKMAVQMFGGKK